VKTFIEAALPIQALQRYSLSGATMGTRYSAIFYAPAGLDSAALAAYLYAAVDNVDQQMSTYRPDSALNQLNAAPLQHWLELPKELIQVLQTALLVGEQSNGAFDIAVGDLVNAWGFGPAHTQPDLAQINRLQTQQRQSATTLLAFDPSSNRVRKLAPACLDLNGIAKGFAVDQLAAVLDAHGISRYLVGIDGEMRARGLKADGQPWSVAVEKPQRGIREVMGVMELSDVAIATSGDYRHWRTLAGQDYAHSMHPLLTTPLHNSLTAVTVLASTCMLADAWATALLVLGETAGPQLAQELGLHALFVLRDGDSLRDILVIDGLLQG
jgi:thiamine biosynthesis lipoprotein